MSLYIELENALNRGLNPEYLEIINESNQHSGPRDAETHFKVVCSASAFEGLNRVKRHQTVYGLAQSCLDAGVHALALHLYSPEEWSQRSGAPESPKCMGGSKTI